MFRIRLKTLREEAGYSQYSFADAFGCAQSTVGSWEAGRREPSIDTILKLADFFHVTTDYLLGRTDYREARIQEIETESGVVEIETTRKEPFTPEQFEAIREEIIKQIENSK